VYVRRKGYGPDEAQDLTQEFFAQLIDKEHLRLADRNKGKFRTFLLSILDYFLAREWNRAIGRRRWAIHFRFTRQQAPEDRYRLERPTTIRRKRISAAMGADRPEANHGRAGKRM